ncbi:MAG: radical SAM protein, partial [uncultured bacterium]
ADLVGVSTVSNTTFEAYKIAERVRKLGIPVVIGGPHATFEKMETLQYADFVITGEGEHSMLELIEALEGRRELSSVRGLCYRDKLSNKIVEIPTRPFCSDINFVPDFSLIRGFKSFYDKPIRFSMAPLQVLTSRGCPYGCRFCSVIKMSGRKFRFRDVESVVGEIEQVLSKYKRKNIFFVDDNFTANRKRAIELLNLIIKRKINATFSAQVRADTGKDEELLKLMKKSGMHLVQIGLESVNPDTLKFYKKSQGLQDMKDGLRGFRKYGIKVHGMFVLGSDFDTLDTIDATVQFAIEQKLVAIQLLALGPLPGTDLTNDMMKQNRVISRDWSKYDGNHTLIFPKKMKPSELQERMFRAYRKFYSLKRTWRYIAKRSGVFAGVNLYGYLSTRYFEFLMKPYLKFLKIVELGKYENGKLLENIHHEAEEAPLEIPNKLVYRLFGNTMRVFSNSAFIRLFKGNYSLKPVALKLPSSSSFKKITRFPAMLSKVLRKTKRPVIIDCSELRSKDKKFWQKLVRAVAPFGERVKILVGKGTYKSFTKFRSEFWKKSVFYR